MLSVQEACISVLKAASAPSDKVWTNIRVGSHEYRGLDLIWDGKDVVVVISCCWSTEDIDRTRKDLQLFATHVGFVGLNKKIHLIMIHDEALESTDYDFPVGVSYSPIALKEGLRSNSEAPTWLRLKLESVLGISDVQSQNNTQDDTISWRWFLSTQQILDRVKAISKEKPLPDDMERLTLALLKSARDGEDLQQRVKGLLTQAWEGRS